MNRSGVAALIAVLLAGCSKPYPQQRSAQPHRPAPVTPMATKPALRKPAPTLDPKSNEAAEELVRGLARLLNSGRLDDAYMLLGANAPPRADFDRQFAGYSHLKVTPGGAGAQDGAAGSIYVAVPLTISGDVNGRRIDRSADAVLRRTNDVPGSTEAQRRWHIERIEWK